MEHLKHLACFWCLLRHMLAVALVCELHKSSFKEVLIEDGHTPFHRLESAVSQVEHEALKNFLQEVLELARP